MSARTPLPSPLTPQGGVAHYRDHILDELRHDPYQAKRKYAEPTVCPDCGLVFERGRWHHAAAPNVAHEQPCPACRRTAERLPAGFVTINGPFARLHRAELVALVRNEAEREGKDHPLHRIMAIQDKHDAVEVTTTDLHLPRRIGEALKRAYDGDLHMDHSKDEFMLRVRWSR